MERQPDQFRQLLLHRHANTHNTHNTSSTNTCMVCSMFVCTERLYSLYLDVGQLLCREIRSGLEQCRSVAQNEYAQFSRSRNAWGRRLPCWRSRRPRRPWRIFPDIRVTTNTRDQQHSMYIGGCPTGQVDT